MERRGRGDLDETVFAPGSLLGGRYRIIARLGKGGMGEVYRADDLKLGQQVALKFLPAGFAAEARRLERFRDEVRISRQISHPSVCRVYDLNDVEVGGGTAGGDGGTLHFLSMEYIDGEDLSSLLRRIGRLPKDKAVQVARQVCAGLAAAHNAGVLHRDLKPANIMLDGRGQAKIMDFGIAGAIGGITGGDVRSGTPAYMAPESLAGREVSPRSDIYSLGLVLYELFTGRQAFAGETVTTASSTRTATALSRPSTIIDDMDPAVERVIMRCLDDEPSNRPGSALSVAAALPGGDPLLAALEAGETPSPELVAAAGPTGTIKPAWAGAMVGFGVVCIVFFLWASRWTAVLSQLPLERSPIVLEDRAKEMLRTLGYDEPAKDDAMLVQFRREYLAHLLKEHPSDPARWEALRTGRPAVVRYTYRSSIFGELMPVNAAGVVRASDPHPSEPGMRQVDVDTKGRLISLTVPPPPSRKRRDRTQPDAANAGTDGSANAASIAANEAAGAMAEKLFELAELDIKAFERVRPIRRPPHDADVHLAWAGALPGDEMIKWRVEAAFTDGKPTWFRQFGRWDIAPATDSSTSGFDDELGLDLGSEPAPPTSTTHPTPPRPPPHDRSDAERPQRTPGLGDLVIKSPLGKEVPPGRIAPPAAEASVEAAASGITPAPSSAPANTPPPAPAAKNPPPDEPRRGGGGGVQSILQAGVLLTVIAGILFAGYYARRNYRIGRGDALGASRLAGSLIVMRLITWACTAHHSTSMGTEWNRFIYGLALSLVPASIAWMLYMALEPIVRRRDPHLLVSWTRLLSGKWRDPLVGRHILLSCCVGCAIVLCISGYSMLAVARGRPVDMLFFPNEQSLDGVPGTIAFVLSALVQATINGLLVLFFYVGVGAIVRVKAVAIGLLFVFVSVLVTSDGGNTALPEPGLLALLIAMSAGMTYFIVRFGLLAIIIMHFVFIIVRGAPATTDLNAWHATGAVVGLLLVAALFVFGFVSATARWPSSGPRSFERKAH